MVRAGGGSHQPRGDLLAVQQIAQKKIACSVNANRNPSDSDADASAAETAITIAINRLSRALMNTAAPSSPWRRTPASGRSSWASRPPSSVSWRRSPSTSSVDLPTAALAIAAFAVLYRFHGKLTELYVVLGCGAIAALLQPSGVS
jgi:hypothetical protein